jgi:hypothetical protein
VNHEWKVKQLTNSIDGNTSSDPLLDLGGETSELGVGSRVEVVVVDVTLSVRSSLLGGLEGDADEVLAQNTREDRVAEGTVLGEDLVDDVLVNVNSLITVFDVDRNLPKRSTSP